MKNLKKLSRNELVNIKGGDNPSGTYVCCWSNDPSSCSAPVTYDHGSGAGDLSCVDGAHLKKVKALSSSTSLD